MKWWWEKDPRYGQPGWCVIHDQQGTRFVYTEPKPRRRAARNLRFPDLKVDDVMIHRGTSTTVQYQQPLRLPGLPPIANDDMKEIRTDRRFVALAICTDRWFDPVAGQKDPLKGDMVGFRRITGNGLTGEKNSHPIRGMASNGYWPTTDQQSARVREFINERAQLVDEWQRGIITQAEVRVRATTWRQLIKDLGLDGDMDW